MADTNITIPELGSLTAGQVSDLLLVTRGTTGYKMLVSDIAKTIIETYAGSSLAGSAQSVKAALDSLNSRQSNTVTPTSGWTVGDVNICQKVGKVVEVDFWVSASTVTTNMWTTVGTLPTGFYPYATFDFTGVDNTGKRDSIQAKIQANGEIRVYILNEQSKNFRIHAVYLTS